MESNSPAGLLEAYLAKRPDLVRFFALRLRSSEAGEDLVQEIYLKIAAMAPGAEVHNPAAYLYRLGGNLMLDRLRGERRAALRDSDWRAGHHVQVGQEDVVDAPVPEDAIAARQRLTQIVDALAALPPLTQSVFRMHKFDAMTHVEVAQALGISRSAVEKHVSSALKHLLTRLERA